MRRYRLMISKFVYPLVSFICIMSGLQFYKYIEGYMRWKIEKEKGLLHNFYNIWIFMVTILFILFFLFIVISFILFLKQPRMKEYEKSLMTVLEFEELEEDVIETKGKELQEQVSYRLSAKRTYCPNCHTSTDGVIGTNLTCENCGEIFTVS